MVRSHATEDERSILKLMEHFMRLLDEEGLRAKGIDLHRSTLWRLTKAGKFPKPVMVGNRHCWVEAEIDAHIKALVEARDVGVA